jgi:hypothetical protein
VSFSTASRSRYLSSGPTAAMMKMVKLDIAALKKAYEG